MNIRSNLVLVFLMGVFLAGCATHHADMRVTSDQCLEQLRLKMDTRPVQTHLKTLDGQLVRLDEFFAACIANSPACALPQKFYHWENDVKVVTSNTPDGIKKHKIRTYHNYMTICRPDLTDPLKTHGDIAEFYNEAGEFMGLAVYAGDGLYFPMPYSKYKGGKDQLNGFI